MIGSFNEWLVFYAERKFDDVYMSDNYANSFTNTYDGKWTYLLAPFELGQNFIGTMTWSKDSLSIQNYYDLFGHLQGGRWR